MCEHRSPSLDLRHLVNDTEYTSMRFICDWVLVTGYHDWYTITTVDIWLLDVFSNQMVKTFLIADWSLN